MDNLGKLGEALPELPQEDFHNKLPIELRQKIYKTIYDMGEEELGDKKKELKEIQAERQNRKEGARGEVFGDLGILQAQRREIQVSREYTKMERIIRQKAQVYNRLLRMRNEPPF